MTAGRRWPAPLIATHGCSLSNAVLLVADALDLFAAEDVKVEVPLFRAMGSSAALLADGMAGVGTVAFTQPLVHRGLADPPIVVAGSGRRGVTVLARPEVTEIADLRGQPVGTFAGDPMQLLVHDFFAAHDLGPLAEVCYSTIEETVQDFAAGRLAAITIVEPYATRLRADGARTLTDGTDLWAPDFPDTVLVAARSMLAEQPGTVRRIIRALRHAEQILATEPASALEGVTAHFPGFSGAELAQALPAMPPGTDIRHLESIFTDRWPRLAALGLVAGDAPTRPPVCWGLLDAVLADEMQTGRTSP